MHRRPTTGASIPNGSGSSSANGATTLTKGPRMKRKKKRRIRPKNETVGFWGREQSVLFATLSLLGIVMMVLNHLSSDNGDETLLSDVHNSDAVSDERRHRGGEGGTESRSGGLLSRINPHFFDKRPRRPDEMEGVGDKSRWYRDLRATYDPKMIPASDHERRKKLVSSMRKREYVSYGGEIECPPYPPQNYPRQWPIMDIINNWNPDDTTTIHESIYRGICIFDHEKDLDKILTYRNAEVPFVVRDDPEVLRTVERWSHPEYLKKLLGDEPHRAEYSENNHFMYWMVPNPKKKNNARRQNKWKPPNYRERRMPEGWKKPTEMIKMTYPDWLSKANVTDDKLGPDNEHWYFRLIGCGLAKNCDKITSEFLFDELPYFQPRDGGSLYVVEPEAQRGIHCRFGMKGVIAENHFDGSRNVIALLGGERRYILSHPDQCLNLALLPKDHPSGRHSAVDWSDPDLDEYPQFRNAVGNEVVLQAGDVLYLPTHWFHYIVSLELNFQCNTRSGIGVDYTRYMRECGF